MATKGETQGMRVLKIQLYTDGTLNYQQTAQVDSPISIEEKRGMRIHSIDYYCNQLIARLAADGDELQFGLSFLAQQPSTGNFYNTAGVLDYNWVGGVILGVPAQKMVIVDPYIHKDLHLADPKGMLVHPGSLYKWTHCGNALAGACYIGCNIFYEMVDISDEEWNMLWKQIFVQQVG